MAVTSAGGVAVDRDARGARRRSESALVWAQLRRNRGAVAGAVVVLLLVLMALAAPALAPYDPTAGSLLDAMRGPSRAHPLGTDALGRDVLSRLIFGARISLQIGIISLAIAGSVGTLFGLLAGFYGGW